MGIKMKFFKGRILPVLLASLVLVGGANVAAYSVTGGNFRLGFINKANKPSQLVNTSTGPALRIKTSLAAPPLAVNSKKVVTNLNADTVDGQHAAAFQPKVGPLVWHNLTLAGTWAGGCYGNVPAYAIQLGVVYLRGDICSGTTNSVAFTLPAEARPVRRAGASVWLTADTFGATTGRIWFYTADGIVHTQSDPASAGSDSGFLSLEGISFTK
jgi:hypothetical protein